MESGDGSSTPRRGRRPGRADSRIASVTDRRHLEDGQRRVVELLCPASSAKSFFGLRLRLGAVPAVAPILAQGA
jgi:hypothetical protein